MKSPAPAHLPWTHALLALAVVAVWGTNFVVIKLALNTFTPLWLGAMRFALVLVPAVLLLKRPPVPWRWLAAYGFFIGAGQFGLLFMAMKGHITPGLASLVIQSQVFFTIGFSVLLRGERLLPLQWLALALAVSGLLVIALHADADVTPLGVAMVLAAAMAWAVGNTVSQRAGRVNMLAFVVWGSLFSCPPLAALAWWVEGPNALLNGVSQATSSAWLAVAWQAVGNTLFGYVAWGWLLARHAAGTITPMALLVPIFGLASSAWWLAEAMPAWKLWATTLVLAGLALNLLAPRWARPVS